jgi:hypothetical protein
MGTLVNTHKCWMIFKMFSEMIGKLQHFYLAYVIGCIIHAAQSQQIIWKLNHFDYMVGWHPAYRTQIGAEFLCNQLAMRIAALHYCPANSSQCYYGQGEQT